MEKPKTRHGLEIRGATAAEAPGLSALLAATGQEIAPHVVAARLEAMRQDPGAVLVALEWGPPSGLVVLHWYRTLQAARPMARITTLLVGPEQRRRGIGRLLVKAASQAARNAACEALELAAPPGAGDMQSFCLATGFVRSQDSFIRALRKKG